MEDKRKLFVGGISFNSTDDSLRSFFEQAGTVEEAVIIMDRQTGRSKGFGFVTMATEEEAAAAIDKLNGQELDGRAISVNVARPKTDNGDRGGFRR